MFPHRQTFFDYLRGSSQCLDYVVLFLLVSGQHLPHLLTTKHGEHEEKPGTDTLAIAKAMADVNSCSASNLFLPMTFYLLFLLHSAYWQGTTNNTDLICNLQNGVAHRDRSLMHTCLGHTDHPCACYKRYHFLWQTQLQLWVPIWWEKWESGFSLHRLGTLTRYSDKQQLSQAL